MPILAPGRSLAAEPDSQPARPGGRTKRWPMPRIELFETAHVYLPQPGSACRKRSADAGRSPADAIFWRVKGDLWKQVRRAAQSGGGLKWSIFNMSCSRPAEPANCGSAASGSASSAKSARRHGKQFELREPATVRRGSHRSVGADRPIGAAGRRVVAVSGGRARLESGRREAVRWADVAAAVRQAAGADLERLEYHDTYRDPEKIGAGKQEPIDLRSRSAVPTEP